METTVEIWQREAKLIEGLRDLVERYTGERQRVQAEDALVSLANRLRSRIQLEDESLFPAIEALVRMPQFEPTARMRRQHRVLVEIVAGIERALRANAWDAALGDLRELKAALHTHLEEERRVLWPMLGAEAHGRA